MRLSNSSTREHTKVAYDTKSLESGTTTSTTITVTPDPLYEVKQHQHQQNEEDEEDTHHPRREGGKQAWLTVLGSSLVYFSTLGLINSFGFFQSYYQTHDLRTTPASTIAFIGTLQILLANVLAAPAGGLFDCFGVRYLYIFSGLGCTSSLLILSFADFAILWQPFVVQGVLLGLAIAFGAQPALVIVGQHFARRRALVMSVVAASGSVGGVCFPLMFDSLVASTGSLAWSLRVVAGVVGVCFAVALAVSRERGYGEQEERDGASREKRRTGFAIFDFGGFGDARYGVVAVGAFGALLGQFVPYYYINSYSAAANFPPATTSLLLPLMSATSILGRVLGGLTADHLGALNTTIPNTILSGLFCLVMWLPCTNISTLIAFTTLYGFTSGVFIAVLPVIIAQISPEEKMGGRIGAFYCFVAVAQFVGSPVGGALITKKGEEEGGGVEGYRRLVVFAGVTMLVGGLVLGGARVLCDRRLRSKW